MAQQLINIGAANAKTGDTLFIGGTKINENFTELYDLSTTSFINSESDFPVQDATTITLEDGVSYVMPSSFTVTKRFVSEANGACSFVAFGFNSTTITYTGAGTMFTGVDASIEIMNIALEPGATNNLMDYSSTTPVTNSVVMDKVLVGDCVSFGTFTNLFVVLMDNCSSTSTTGVLFTGDFGILSMDRTNFTGGSSLKAVDINSATFAISVNMSRLSFIGPAGAFGISGLTNSGNIATGLIATVALCEFIGDITPLENITNDDTRWNFANNGRIPDTQPDALLSINGNGTSTVISSSSSDGSNAVLVAGTWVCQRESQFSCDASGKITYLGERNLTTPIDVLATLDPSGDSTLAVYIALNGSAIPETGLPRYVKSSDPGVLSTMWQLSLEEGDELEIFVENQSGTDNITVSDAIFRVR